MRFVAAFLVGLVALVGLAFFLWTSQSVEPQPVVEEPDTTEADIEAVREIVDRFDAALAAGDADAMAGIYAPDAVRMQNELPAWEGRDAIRAGFAREFDGREGEQVDNVVQEVIILGNHVIMRGTYTATVTPEGGGEPSIETGKWMSLAIRSADDGWLIHWDIWNRDAPLAEQ